MLFSVEGGGFFSSSASGYSLGLTLLLLGHKNEEKLMRVTPRNQYQLVDQQMDSEVQLVPVKSRLVHGCTSVICFGRAATPESPSPLRVGPAQNQEVLPELPNVDKGKDQTCLSYIIEDDSSRKTRSFKSSLKKSVNNVPVAASDGNSVGTKNEHEVLCEKENGATCQTEKRRVQWTDTNGGELFEIRQFEMSEDESDEFDLENDEICSCRIM